MARSVTPAFLTALRGALGHDHVLDDAEALATYGTDWTRVHPPRPGAVALPRTTEEVARVVRLCAEHDVAVVPSGGRTGLAAGAVASRGELVLSLRRMNRVGEVDRVGRTLHVEAGAITADVHAAAEAAGLRWPIDLGSRGSCTVGGNLSTNAGGVRVIRYGCTRQWVRGLVAVLADGEVLETGGALVKNNTGYDLVQLLVGSEGTLAVITEATLQLTAPPPATEVLFFAVPDIDAASALLVDVTEAGLVPVAFEMLTDACLRAVEGRGLGRSPFGERHPVYALLEVERPEEGRLAAWLEHLLGEGKVSDGVQATSEKQRKDLWALREKITTALADGFRRVHKDDLAVPVAGLPAFAHDVSELASTRYPELPLFLFGHIGDGNLHVNLVVPDDMELERYEEACAGFDQDVGALLSRHQGSVSAEHGIGLLKLDLLAYTRSAREIALMTSIKQAFDPRGLLNPGKVLKGA